MQKVNETVALLVPNYRASGVDDGADLPLFEVFDYLVDVLAERTTSPDRVQRDKALIPLDMYRLVAEAASRTERPAVEMAARAQSEFVGRTEELAELAYWLASPPRSSPPLGMLYGIGGVGKTAIVRRLLELGDTKTRELMAGDPAQLRLNVPVFDAVLAARGRTAAELLEAMSYAAGAEPVLGEPKDVRTARLRNALHNRDRPLIVAIDGLDEAIDPEQSMHMLLDVFGPDTSLPLRILVSTRQHPPRMHGIGRVFELGPGTREDLLTFAHQRLAGQEATGSGELAETARVIADFAEGSFLAASIICSEVVSGSLPSDPAKLQQTLADPRPPAFSRPLGRRQFDRWLDSLGERKPDALVMLTALARGTAEGLTADEWVAAASRLANRPYSKADLDWVSGFSAVERSPVGEGYLLHPLVRALVLDYQYDSPARPPRTNRA